MTFTSNVWPLHPRPRTDELLSSWLFRLAWAYQRSARKLCDLVLPDSMHWHRDIDLHPPQSLISLLVEKTAVPLSRVQDTTFLTYQGILFETATAGESITPWIVPVHLRNRILPSGLPFCPLCLAEDDVPYFRRSWRLAFVTVCEHHRMLLVDRCPHCAQKINFDWDQKPGRLSDCPSCSKDLAVIRRRSSPALDRVIDWQRALREIVEAGGTIIESTGDTVQGLLYFMGIHQMMSALASGPKANLLRNSLYKRVKAHSFVGIHPYSAKDIELLPVADRFVLLAMISWLMEKWPNRFLELCHSKKVTPWQLQRDKGKEPFWYQKVVKQFDTRYFPSDEEILSVVNYLKKKRRRVGEANIEKLLGVRIRSGIGNESFR